MHPVQSFSFFGTNPPWQRNSAAMDTGAAAAPVSLDPSRQRRASPHPLISDAACPEGFRGWIVMDCAASATHQHPPLATPTNCGR